LQLPASSTKQYGNREGGDYWPARDNATLDLHSKATGIDGGEVAPA